ncbi:MAG: hypothetical protein FJX97_08850, partial [Bacteroidetes bacterium]|nr:hypothetical protein [Bacteroidota bacterium]
MKPTHFLFSFLLLSFSVSLAKAQHFADILRSELSSSNPGVLFTIESGDGTLSWSGATGINDRSLGD